jgi:hypothetical protein
MSYSTYGMGEAPISGCGDNAFRPSRAATAKIAMNA